jgi:hypothetical protein
MTAVATTPNAENRLKAVTSLDEPKVSIAASIAETALRPFCMRLKEGVAVWDCTEEMGDFAIDVMCVF